VVTQEKPPNLAREQGPKPFLALDQRQGGGAFAFEVEKVENEEDQGIRAALVHRSLQAAEPPLVHRMARLLRTVAHRALAHDRFVTMVCRGWTSLHGRSCGHSMRQA
jgi:hypothetical protein